MTGRRYPSLRKLPSAERLLFPKQIADWSFFVF